MADISVYPSELIQQLAATKNVGDTKDLYAYYFTQLVSTIRPIINWVVQLEETGVRVVDLNGRPADSSTPVSYYVLHCLLFW